MIQPTPNSTGALWAQFRFSVVGSLLSSPPARGTFHSAIRPLAAMTWPHPDRAGRIDWFRSHPSPNRAGGSPAWPVPVGLTSMRVDGPVHRLFSGYTVYAWQSRH